MISIKVLKVASSKINFGLQKQNEHLKTLTQLHGEFV